MNILILIILLIFLCIVGFLVYQQIKPELTKSDNIYNLKKDKPNTQKHIYISNWLKNIDIKQEQFAKLKLKMSKYIYGMDDVINAMIIWLITHNHILLSGYPWLAKTTSIKRFANLLWLNNGRIQGSVDLQPTDIIGQNIYNPSTNLLESKLGPINNNIILVDEINRMTPKSQSALLQAMAENCITIDGKIHTLPYPFMILATMNPHDDYGTFPMSAANLDRFAMGIYIDRPTDQDEKKIINWFDKIQNFDDKEILDKFNIDQKYSLTWEHLDNIYTGIQNIYISDELQDIILSIVKNTRNSKYIKTWLGPRSSIYISQISKAIAWLEWLTQVSDRHIYMSLSSVISHRLTLTDNSKSKMDIIYDL